MTVEIGIRLPHGLLSRGPDALAAFGEVVDASELDRVWIGDHVSFRDGRGSDGLLVAMALAAVTTRVVIETAVYLLPLRHPLAVARQIAGVAELAPARFVFGVGIGGEDPLEVRNCGVDPRTRGARMDESLTVLRQLLDGDVVHHTGTHFTLERAAIVPAPPVRVPIVVGGRSDAALDRAGRLGDGWLGVWVTPQRFVDSTRKAGEAAAAAGRTEVANHGFLAWCALGESRSAARAPLAAAMESFYGLPFERFERTSPYGTVLDVVEALEPYVEAGATSILLSPVGPDADEAVARVDEVRSRLRRGTGP